ncbi:uncharacterized protein N7482_002470 [Penicillium canariense]|uniref:Uncharacterized protein n=1 Tax=Penicillium canariense TaxID=189055 RepID=A0A9W9IH19_9EURO|nr:uncharacterized protein N7482_002470 [Penicillium canariense]KAJ5176593.1 hypothetical protein N7482_002470 [Penicillium canariense]
MGLHLSQLCRTSHGKDRSNKQPPSDPECTQEKVFGVLRDFLEPKSPLPLDLAVESLLKLLPTDAPDSEEIWRFGEDCFELAEMSSFKTSSHSRLAQLLEALGLSSHFTFLSAENGRIWRFDLLKYSMKDFCAGPDGGKPERYVNYNSFLAHLYEHRIFPTDPTYAVWAMRAAFEDERSDEEKAVRSAWILGAAQWILWNGQSIFNLILEPALYDVTYETWPDRAAWDAGCLYNGTAGLSLERWQFWKRRFGEVSQDSEVTDECKEVSTRAMAIMDLFEKNMVF